MKLYLLRAGDRPSEWVGTLAEAKARARALGREWLQQDVPTDKEGLLDFLNNSEVVHKGQRLAEIAEKPSAPPTTTPGRCPRCGMSPKAAEQRAAGMNAAAIAEEIMKSDGFVLSILAGAVAERFREIKAIASRLAEALGK